MPGYEPFLLCDFHVHTTWSDGKLTVGEVVDLYGATGKFDVIAITDHILMKKDLLARAGRLATLGRRAFGVREEDFDAYLDDIREQGERARKTYGMIVVPGVEVTQNRIRSKKNSHIIALDVKRYVSADQRADDILREIRRQGALSIACHPHHRTTRRIEISTCYLWDHRDELADLVDVWEAGNRDDLFSVTSLKHFPYWPTATCCLDALPQRILGCVTARHSPTRDSAVTAGSLLPTTLGAEAQAFPAEQHHEICSRPRPPGSRAVCRGVAACTSRVSRDAWIDAHGRTGIASVVVRFGIVQRGAVDARRTPLSDPHEEPDVRTRVAAV